MDLTGSGGGPVRLLEVTGAVLLLVLASPLLLAGMAVVWIGDGRPLLFAHRRLGAGGRPFLCWKLRTMRLDAEARLEREPDLRRRYLANGFKLPAGEDPRIIPGGRWLRKTHVDEVPQLFNVLRGDLSLVGPRPVVEEELALFGEDAGLLLSRRPGVFGAWTARGRSRPSYPERARLEIEYVRDPSPARNLGILARTVLVVLRGQADG